ncbi:MAG TPA: hypothetical protein VFG37_14900 [Planctomycetota bacterium]|nr:hypothetical protein [Planctomycetota bacterium]
MTRHDDGTQATPLGSTDPALGVRGPSALPPSPPLSALAVAFVLLIFGVPIGQAAYEHARGEPIQALDYLAPFVGTPAGGTLAARIEKLGRDLASAERLRAFEARLHDVSFLKRAVLPWYQRLLVRWFGQGTREAVVGRDGWLFYGDDLASAYGRGFLEPGVGGRAALEAIADFRDQLAARDVKLLLVPSYSKEMLDPDRIARATAGLASAANPDLERFYDELAARRIEFVRMDRIFAECRAARGGGERSLGLPRDTHWSPETMAFATQRIAERVRALLGESEASPTQLFVRRSVEVEAGGDLTRMLGLPESRPAWPPMRLSLQQVAWKTTGEPLVSDPEGEVVLLGDSLTNAFSRATLGLGEAAGFGEQLAFELDRPVDVIALDGKSATGVREALARRPDGLAGKRIVVWQFGVRMLALGDREWRKVELPKPGAERTVAAGAPQDVAPPATVVATLMETTHIDPAKWDYPFCLGVMEYRVDGVEAGKVDGERIWVAFPILEKHQATAANSFTPGLRHRLVLEDVRLHHDLERVSWGDDTDAGATIYFPVKWEPAAK